jgi:hypothetical protein
MLIFSYLACLLFFLPDFEKNKLVQNLIDKVLYRDIKCSLWYWLYTDNYLATL